MSTGQPRIEGLENLRNIAKKAHEDDDYRRRLINDPVTVLTTEDDLEVPPGVTVVVLENSDDTIYLVLPTEPKDENQLKIDETKVTVLQSAMLH